MRVRGVNFIICRYNGAVISVVPAILVLRYKPKFHAASSSLILAVMRPPFSTVSLAVFLLTDVTRAR